MKRPVTHRRHSTRTPKLAALDSTNDEIARARSVLDALIASLEHARRALDALPTSHSGRSVATSAQKVDAHAVPGQASTDAEDQARALCDQINSWI